MTKIDTILKINQIKNYLYDQKRLTLEIEKVLAEIDQYIKDQDFDAYIKSKIKF